MEVAKLSSKGQVSIPQAIREAARLSPGDRIGFEMRKDEIILIPLRVRTIAELRGAWKTKTVISDIASLRDRRSQELAKQDRKTQDQ